MSILGILGGRHRDRGYETTRADIELGPRIRPAQTRGTHNVI